MCYCLSAYYATWITCNVCMFAYDSKTDSILFNKELFDSIGVEDKLVGQSL